MRALLGGAVFAYGQTGTGKTYTMEGLAKGPLALKDYRSFPRALADMRSARKVISLITGVIKSQLI